VSAFGCGARSRVACSGCALAADSADAATLNGRFFTGRLDFVGRLFFARGLFTLSAPLFRLVSLMAAIKSPLRIPRCLGYRAPRERAQLRQQHSSSAPIVRLGLFAHLRNLSGFTIAAFRGNLGWNPPRVSRAGPYLSRKSFPSLDCRVRVEVRPAVRALCRTRCTTTDVGPACRYVPYRRLPRRAGGFATGGESGKIIPVAQLRSTPCLEARAWSLERLP